MKHVLLFIALAIVISDTHASDTKPTKNMRTGMLSWKVVEPHVSFELIQLSPDYVKAVFSSRGLPEKVVNTLNGYCVFGTIIKNTSSTTLGYKLADWRYVSNNNKTHQLKLKSEWSTQWAEMDVPFRWLLLPEEQNFNIGDWSQGFTTYKLPPDSQFNLLYSWRYQGKKHKRVLNNISCSSQ